MKYKILFPCQSYNLHVVDEAFRAEANCCDILGIKYELFDHDTFVESGAFKSTISIPDNECDEIIYRGWMLKPLEYQNFCGLLASKTNFNIFPINNKWEYSNCHCFPMVYDSIKQYTPRIQELTSWGDIYTIDIKFDFFIKDHVKSIKTADGVEKLDKDIYMRFKDDLVYKIADFVKDRGKLFTGNIVLKEFVDLKRVEGKTNEWRVFYLKGEFLAYFQNSYLKTSEHPPFKLIGDVGKCLQYMSNFFTMDFALTENDDWILIETGDGQVSGFPEGKELQFYNAIFNKLQIK